MVIFCTAHTAHAVAAFDVGAIDYLLKPVEAARLRKALERARERDARRRYRDELARLQEPRRADGRRRWIGWRCRPARGSCCWTR